MTSKAAAKRRLADEYDAAQERGEVARGRPKSIPGGNTSATTDELGLTSKEIYEDRRLRVAEAALSLDLPEIEDLDQRALVVDAVENQRAAGKLEVADDPAVEDRPGRWRGSCRRWRRRRKPASRRRRRRRPSRQSTGRSGEGLGQVAPAGFSGGSSAKRPRYSASGQTPRRRGSLPRGRGADPTPFYGTVLLLKAKGPGPARARIGCYPRRYPEITAGCKLGAISDLCS